MTLGQQTGHASYDRLVSEARELVVKLWPARNNMKAHERDFLFSVRDAVKFNARPVTPKMLYWLRDLNVKY